MSLNPTKTQATLQDSPELLPRDRLLRDTFTPAETMAFWLVLLVASGSFLITNPRSIWLLGGLMILGALVPAILKTHEHTHPFFVDKLWPMFWLCSAPLWLFVLHFITGHLQNPLIPVDISGENYFALDAPANFWPTSATLKNSWITAFGFGAAYLVALLLFLIPKSRYFFERLLQPLCTGAVVLAIFGFLQFGIGMEKPLLTKGTGLSDFFAFFPYDGHWAAFATLWCGACISMGLLSMRSIRTPAFIYSSGPWYLTGGILLGATGFIVNAPIPAAFLLLTLAVFLAIAATEFFLRPKEPHRKTLTILCGTGACGSLAGATLRFLEPRPLTEETALLREAASAMFRERPAFGWGLESYPEMLPFFANDRLLGQHFERANSDWLQLMAELGLFGLAVCLALLASLLIRYLLGSFNIRLTNHLLVGCAAVALLAFWDTPFMSPAVFFSFFVLFFSAMRWADITRNEVDEVDAARPQLVTPDKLRRVPFFKPQHKDPLK